jgi:hypothetical protein
MIAVYGFEACVSRDRVKGSKGEGAMSVMLGDKCWKREDVARDFAAGEG